MASAGRLGRAVARSVIAVVFTGPLGALQAASEQAVDLFWNEASIDKDPIDKALSSIGDAVERFACSEHLPDGSATRAVDNARLVITRFGLTASELMAVSLDPRLAAGMVMSRASRLLTTFDEADTELTGHVVHTVYASLVDAAPRIPEFASAYQRELLSRAARIKSMPEDVRQFMLHVGAHAMIADPSRVWSPHHFPVSALLRAEYGVVPFWGREDEITDLAEWANTPAQVAARLYTAAGGMGKTRLMIELCRRLRTKRWRTGFLRPEVSQVLPEHLTRLGHDAAGVLIVVDYCETRQSVVADLIGAALTTSANVRVVLLARAAADWWHQLRRLPDAVGDFLNGPAVTVQRLFPLAPDSTSRKEVAELAADTFARLLERPQPGVGGDLTADVYDRVLFLHLRALAAVDGTTADGFRDLLEFALRREQGFWDAGLRAADLALLAGRPIRQAAAVATLAGSASGREQATRLLAQAPLLAGQPAAVLEQVAELLHRTYPSDQWLAGVQPDLLGEYLVEQAIQEDPSLPAALYGS